MFGTSRLKEQPDVQIGPHCDDPYACPLHDHCWKFLPPDNVTTLYRGAKKAFRLLADGIINIKDIPAGYRGEKIVISGDQTWTVKGFDKVRGRHYSSRYRFENDGGIYCWEQDNER